MSAAVTRELAGTIMSKYDPLRSYLTKLKQDEWRASFGEIERMLGFPLPYSARTYPAWWGNDQHSEGRHAQAWLRAGWRTANLNLTRETVVFHKEQESPIIEAAQRASSATRTGLMLDFDHLLGEISRHRPVFHSEADFQHALAWCIHERYPDAKLRLEYKPFPEERLYVDIWVSGAERAAIELKYLTRGLEIDLDGERFSLKNQSAQDTRRYDVLRDVARLERVVSAIPSTTGYAVVLTNDSAYWKTAMRSNTMDAAFRIHEGLTMSGTLQWSERASKGTVSGREAPIELTGSYRIAWRNYSSLPANSYGQMRYLLIEVP